MSRPRPTETTTAAQTATNDAHKEALEALRDMYCDRTDVTGYDIGFKRVGGLATNKLCLRVHVHSKLPEDELDPGNHIVRRINGFPVDVVASTYKVHRDQGDGQGSYTTTLLSGSPCQRRGAHGGTIGAIAIDRSTGSAGILSNWHVLSSPEGADSDLVYGGKTTDLPIARLSKSMLSRHGDAAFAPLTGATPWQPTLKHLNLTLTGVAPAALGRNLYKYGRTTGLTHARVDGIGTYKVVHSHADGRRKTVEVDGFRLVPQDISAPMAALSLPGDSGACWVDPDTGAAVGLHMAGEGDDWPGGDCALACHMDSVLERLDLRLATLCDLPKQTISDGATGLPKIAPPLHMMMRPTHSFAPQSISDPQRVFSVQGNIWAEFLRTMLTQHPEFSQVPFDIEDAVADYFGYGTSGEALHTIILASAEFLRDGAVPDIDVLTKEVTFRGVCFRIAEAYRARGYCITA
ncbi:hypothetical protein [Shimia sagamensis]|uniref:Uncharacterized protein n=1 Tax=Shimia sagamensis TaxID=1566352 RepID=A0ABY1NMP0_9RHOB|nr:hypothetical protein [Shimia sagamensis]SMP13478.1 hypothetical protein SAMN06265373_102513 [Shimia sagamensis]